VQQPPETAAARLAVEISARPPNSPPAASRPHRIFDDGDSDGSIRDRVGRIIRREEVRRRLVDEPRPTGRHDVVDGTILLYLRGC
jgi:hypothetical protein